jgi:hypothetical protein
MSSRFTTFLLLLLLLLIIIMGKKLVWAAAPGIACLLQLSDCSFVVLVLGFSVPSSFCQLLLTRPRLFYSPQESLVVVVVVAGAILELQHYSY